MAIIVYQLDVAASKEDASITLFELVVHHVLRVLPYSAELHPPIFKRSNRNV